MNVGLTRLTAWYSASASRSASGPPNVCGDPRGEHAAERAPATDHVLPQPALRLVQASDSAWPERGPLQRVGDPCLVQAVAALVHRSVQPRGEVALVPARGDPDVAELSPLANGCTVSSIRHPAAIEAHQRHDLVDERRAACRSATSWCRHESSTLSWCSATVAISGTSSALQLREQGRDLGALHAGLVVVEQRVVGAVKARRGNRRSGARARGCARGTG